MTDNMQFDQFAEEVRAAMEQRYKDDRVMIRRVTKNNGVIYTGITVCSENERVYPTMYLEPFYEEAAENGLTDELIDRMCGIYESRRVGNSLSLDYLHDYSSVKGRLRCKLINYEANEERLEEIPHKRFMDLAIVPYCLLNERDFSHALSGDASFMVTKSNLKIWDITEKEVINDSISNTFSEEQPSITGIYEMLKRLNPALAGGMGDEMLTCPMYVMTTEGCNGAISMIFEDRLKEFCNRINSDIYIIPSSINEIILVPFSDDSSETMLNEMIKEINETQLDRVDVLSDHAYYFNRNTGYAETADKLKKAS